VGTFHAAGSQPAYQALSPMAAWFGQRLDARIAVSDDALALVHDAVGGEFEVLFNGVEAARFRSATPWPTEGPTVLFIGRHEERKGLTTLLEAVPGLPADVRVWVAGVGPQTDELRARHQDPRIEWLGRIDDDERDRRIAGASLFCAPSLGGESFGVILLEAMAAGTPVVASSIPGYAKVATADDGLRAAELVEPGDPVALGAALNRVLSDVEVAATLRDRGLARAEQFDLERLCDLYLDIYERVLADAPV
jgi:phosphatidylinositol alpha-mannosyltransferase